MTPKLKKIIFILLALVLIFMAYVFFVKEDPSVDPLITGSGLGSSVSSDTQILGNKISQALLRIEQIKLDKSIFTNEIYRSLQDRSIPIEQEPTGRSNPFAPIGDISTVSIQRQEETSTSTAATTTQPLTPDTD